MSEEAVYKFPVAPIQTAFFFLNQIHPESLAYNIPLCVRLEGELDREALQQALDFMVHRHEILRTTYDMDDEGVVQIVHETGRCLLSIETLDEGSDTVNTHALDGWLRSHDRSRKHFDLISGPLLYADLAVVSDYEHCLLLTLHHITVDHSAVGLFVNQLEYAYRRFSQKMEVDLPEQELQYADYVVWLKDNTDAQDITRKLDLWTQRLAGFSGLINLPLDRPRPTFSSSEGAQYNFELSEEKSRAIKKFSSEKSVSVYLTLLAMYKVLLHKTCQQNDIIVATPFASRGDQEVLDHVMGCFINTLPLSTNFEGITDFDSLLSSVKEVMLEAYDNQAVPFETIVDAVCPDRNHSYNPLFQAGFIFQEPPREINLPGLKCTNIDIHSGGAMYDFHVSMWEKQNRLAGFVWYNTDIFDEPTVAGIVRSYLDVIDWIILHPDEDVRLVQS